MKLYAQPYTDAPVIYEMEDKTNVVVGYVVEVTDGQVSRIHVDRERLKKLGADVESKPEIESY